MHKTRFLFVFTSYVSWRDSLMTGLLDALSERYELHIASPHQANPHLQDWAKEQGIPLYATPEPKRSARQAKLYMYLTRLWTWWGQYELANLKGVKTIQVNQVLEKEESPLVYAVKVWAWKLIFRFGWGKKLLKWAWSRILQRQEFDTFLTDINPDRVMFHDPFQLNSLGLQYACEQQSRHSIALLRSWDNLSAKGYIKFPMQQYLVWNELMRKELQAFYEGIDAEQIAVVGGLVFDYHATLKNKDTRDRYAFREETQGKRVITFMLNYPDLSPNYLENVKALFDLHAKADWGADTALVIRLQPGPRNKGQAEALQALSYDFILDSPQSLVGDISRTDLEGNLDHFCQVLRHSDLVINYPSTTTIDACIFDIPSVTIAFDGAEDLPYHKSIRRFIDRTHYHPLATCKGNKIVYDTESLLEAINAYMGDPGLDASGRAEIIRKLLDNNVGGSVKKIMASLDPEPTVTTKNLVTG